VAALAAWRSRPAPSRVSAAGITDSEKPRQKPTPTAANSPNQRTAAIGEPRNDRNASPVVSEVTTTGRRIAAIVRPTADAPSAPGAASSRWWCQRMWISSARPTVVRITGSTAVGRKTGTPSQPIRPKVKARQAATSASPSATAHSRRQASHSTRAMIAIAAGSRVARSARMCSPSSASATGAPTTDTDSVPPANGAATSAIRRTSSVRSPAPAGGSMPTRIAVARPPCPTRVPSSSPISARSERNRAISSGVSGSGSRNGRKRSVPG